MLDAAQARIVAYYVEDAGYFLCADHADELYREALEAHKEEHQTKDDVFGGWNYNVWEGFEALGLQAYSRYDMDTMANERAYDLEPEYIIEALENGTSLPGDFGGDQVRSAQHELSDECCEHDGEVI